MASKIVLISDDSDFFEYIKAKLELRKSDELFTFSFDSVPEKLQFLETAVLIVNSENTNEKTLDLLNLFRGTPIIVSAYNEDELFRKKCYRAGMFDFIPLLTPDSEFRSRMIPALTVASILEKNKQYRNVLVKNKIIKENCEIFIDYNNIIDSELEDINLCKKNAVFAAISPSDSNKFLLNPMQIETHILKNTRKNDVLMNYAPNKYFLLMFDTDVKSAMKTWTKIQAELPQKIYAGFCKVSNQKRQQLINEALNKLHEAINHDKNIVDTRNNPVDGLGINKMTAQSTNFKMFKQEFGRKIEQVITPVFYRIQQKYADRFSGTKLKQTSGDGYGSFIINGKHCSSSFVITSPGFSKINIDITYRNHNNSNIEAKRITLEPEELECGLLEDLLEQFILEYKKESKYDT